MKTRILTLEDFKPYLNCFKSRAFKASSSRGRRDQTADADSVFNLWQPFLSDVGKVLESKALRRLKDKTQVYFYPDNPHVRTRLSHTLEVTALALRISSFLGLNNDLVEAIALAHDSGHVPHGHDGEEFISQITGKTFRHEIFGPILLQQIERKGHGLNLSYEVVEGVLNHSRTWTEIAPSQGVSLEATLVMYADKIAYTFSDINDLLRYRHLPVNELPSAVRQLGANQRQRVMQCIYALIKESCEKDRIIFQDSRQAKLFMQVRKWLYTNMYRPERQKIYRTALEISYEFLANEKFFQPIDPAILLALMTDKEVRQLARIKLSSNLINLNHVKQFGFFELVEFLRNKKIDFSRFDFNQF